MPYGDGTGPRGLGPLSGRGAGLCLRTQLHRSINTVPRRGLYGSGCNCFGRGGFRRYHSWAANRSGWEHTGYGYSSHEAADNFDAVGLSEKEQIDILRTRAETLKKHLNDIQGRIITLEKNQTHEKK
jgi:hypothetical protein